MKTTTKAVLFSALIFPGTGHLYLKKYITGCLLLTTAIGALYFIISKSIEIALKVSEKIQSGDMPLDSAGLTEFIATQMSAAETQTQSIASTVLLLAWVIGILDSYRIARSQK